MFAQKKSDPSNSKKSARASRSLCALRAHVCPPIINRCPLLAPPLFKSWCRHWRRGGYVEGVGTWIGEDINHSFVRLLAAHKANGNDVALITPTIDFPKTWKKWVLYLSPSGEHNSVMHDNGDANTVSIESWRVTPSFYLRFRIWICVFSK